MGGDQGVGERVYRFHTADVFTDRRFGGNPLAVLPDARGISDERMQQIAREFNLSETVFVLPAERAGHARRLRIFTPGAELPFAGHPTVGAALVLSWIGEVELGGDRTQIVFEEGVGPVPVALRSEGGRAYFAQLTAAQPPRFQPAPPAEQLAGILGLHSAQIGAAGLEPEAASCGVPFLVVPLRDRAALAQARLQRAPWERQLAGSWAPHLFLVTPDSGEAGVDFRARMFAPALGIEEDPATGGAAAAFAGYLGVRAGDGSHRWVVEQGVEMGRPGRLFLEADVAAGAVTAVRIGGGAVLVSSGEIRVGSGD